MERFAHYSDFIRRYRFGDEPGNHENLGGFAAGGRRQQAYAVYSAFVLAVFYLYCAYRRRYLLGVLQRVRHCASR